MTDENRNRIGIIIQGLAAVGTFILGGSVGHEVFRDQAAATADARVEMIEVLREELRPLNARVERINGTVDVLSRQAHHNAGRIDAIEAATMPQTPTATSR